jgi:antitoxin MazE
MTSQVSKWGNSQGIRMEKRILKSLGLCVGDTVEVSVRGDEIILKPTHNIDWYLMDYERPEETDWESAEPRGREEW